MTLTQKSAAVLFLGTVLGLSGCGRSANTGNEGFGQDTSAADAEYAKKIYDEESAHFAKKREEANAAAAKARAQQGE